MSISIACAQAGWSETQNSSSLALCWWTRLPIPDSKEMNVPPPTWKCSISVCFLLCLLHGLMVRRPHRLQVLEQGLCLPCEATCSNNPKAHTAERAIQLECHQASKSKQAWSETKIIKVQAIQSISPIQSFCTHVLSTLWEQQVQQLHMRKHTTTATTGNIRQQLHNRQ